MENLHRLRRRTLPILPIVLILLFGAMLWFGSSYAQAADRPLDLQQTIPTPLPTAPEPTAVPPTPIPPRPNDEKADQEQEKAEESPAPAESQPEIPAAPQITTTTLLSATVLSPRINMRQGPGSNFAVIGNLIVGTQGTVLGTDASRTWFNLCCLPGTETTGWVSASLVAVEGTAEELAALPVIEHETMAETSSAVVTAERSAPAAAEATPAAAEEAAAEATPAAAEEAAAEATPAAAEEAAAEATPAAAEEAAAEATPAAAEEAAAEATPAAAEEAAAEATPAAAEEAAAEATPAAAEEAAAGATPAAAEEAAAEIAPATLPTTGVNLGGAATLPVVVFLLALLAVGGFVSRRRA